jgi:alpha-N-acetylglucosamine transferase
MPSAQRFRDLDAVFKIPYIYVHNTKLHKQKAEDIQKSVRENFRKPEESEPITEVKKGLTLAKGNLKAV